MLLLYNKHVINIIYTINGIIILEIECLLLCKTNDKPTCISWLLAARFLQAY